MEKSDTNIEQALIPRDISADYQNLITQDYGLARFNELLESLRGEKFLMLRLDLSKVTDSMIFTQKANFMKAFRENGVSKRFRADISGQRRVAIIRCTKKQRNWAPNAFSSDVEWEEATE